MSVKLALSDLFNLKTLDNDYSDDFCKGFCRYSSSNILIFQANNNAASVNLEEEAQNLFDSLAESEKVMQVVLVTSEPRDQDRGAARVIIKCDFVENLVTKYPGASLFCSARIQIANAVSGNNLINIQLPFKNLLKSSTMDYYSPDEIRFMGINPNATYFVTEDPSTMVEWNIHDSSCEFMLADFTLTLALPKEENLQISPAFNKRIFHIAHYSDLTIVAFDGTEFRCHKCFLSARSDVFQAMLLSEDMQEGKSNRIKILDMSKEGIYALLDYIYTFDIEAARDNAEIALELLQAGHKYNIKELEDSIKRLILTWPDKMLEVDSKIEVSLCLFSFVRNVDEMEELKSRAFQVLRKRSTELMGCEYYKELFKKDVSAAKELSALSMGH